MRPIDGDALEAACEQLADKLRNDGQKTDAQLLEALAAIVKFCPTLDVAADGRPAVDNPAVDNPADGRPAVDNPAVDNPADGRPAVESLSVDKGASADGT